MNDRILIFVVWISSLSFGNVQNGPLFKRSTVYKEIFANPGENVVLHCDITNVSGVIRWLQNENELHVGKEDEVEEEEENGSDRFHLGINESSHHHFLRIQGVQVQDDGLWHCQDVRDHQSWILTSKPIRIIVLVPPTHPYLLYEDKRLPEEATFTTKEKNVLSLQCVTENINPAPDKVEWFLDEDNVSETSQLFSEFSPSNRLYYAKSTLILEANRRQHHRTLSCHVYHMSLQGAIATRIVFNILYSPSFVISRIPDFGYPIHEGIEVSLKCDVNANPPSVPQWIKDDGPPPVDQSEDGYLNFSSISREHAGWYRCSTQHQFGIFASFGYFLNVRYEPEIVEQPPPQVQVGLGGTVLLECSADGKPPPSYCWARVKNGGNLESLGMEQNLLLDRILYMDAGVYKCIARNKIGWEEKRADSHNVEVVVTGRPLAEPVNRTLMAVVGHSASFSVHYCANPEPMRVQWIVRNVVLNPGDIIDRFLSHNIKATETENCYLSTLDITDVRREDAGEFLFLVKNSHGIDDAEVLLNITQASFSVSADAIHLSGSIFLLLLLDCFAYRLQYGLDIS